jgi:ketosteroid isomerase-like protein
MDVPHRQVYVADGVIGRAGDAFVAALEVGNAKAASASYTVDARLLAPSAEVFRGREAIERFWRAGVDTGISDVRLETIELVRLSGLAYEIGQYTLGLKPADGIPIVESGKYVRIHEQQADGSWLWALEMFNPEAASAHGRATTTQGGIR